ncbi:hypothetical protein BEP19_08455 [Ammoniphilus oxalaticus]|uniref:Uncharacterized protein n=1 Tax=Ammoniphilus oxalaticus TaxID=66863 RepID=A0A419SK43_9BACL|nr:hypothetical protein [Ammoniphilus oxalaticus]RKD24411.1 hypothetical protein BEP19_08455 [Ammoniphilus oxalaticus]
MKGKLSIASMISLLVASAITVMTIFVPWWQMKFYAPQYQEGLDIIVYPTRLAGDIDIVNGLNHYIGMALFSNESFPELQYMPYIIIAFAIAILVVALIRRKMPLYILIGSFAMGGIVGLLDMYRWLKEFGTNLDPRAPITLDPFIPPIIGKNTIANFVTNSYFSYGGYMLLLVFLLLVFPLWKDRKKA